MARKGYRSYETNASGLLKAFSNSYSDGEIRALAQEPVQNAKDARYQRQTVHVEYRLVHRMTNAGMPCVLLTVTDWGTTGLCGKTDPTRNELINATEEDRQAMRWYHFQRLFDSNKDSRQIGSRGWGKSIFLHCSHIPRTRRSAMKLYDTLLPDSEYRLSDITILDDEVGVRKRPLLNDEARRAVSSATYLTPDGNVSLPLALKPLTRVGTRVIVPYLPARLTRAFRDGSLARWLQYLWWRPIAENSLTITIVDEQRKRRITIDEPAWWKGEIWSSDATTPGEVHRLHQGCHIQLLEAVQLEQDCTVKRLALLHDVKLRDKAMPNEGPDYFGIQMFRAGQCIETYWKFNLIDLKLKAGFRAFVEFDESTDGKLRDIDITAHDKFRRSGIVRNPILPYLEEKFHDFAEEIGLIKSRDREDGAPSESERRTSQFVFDRLLAKAMGDVDIENNGSSEGGETDKPWDIDVLLSYPNPNTSRVDWGQRISNIRFVVNSRPETLRRHTRCVLEWQAPGRECEKLLSRSPKGNAEYGLGYRVLALDQVDDHHIVCPEPGIYRIRAAVYEGKRLVAKKARRIHVEMDPPERQENPFAVSISVENETAPGELRIENGDILRLQINGRNRTHDDVSGHLLLRMREGTVLVSDEPFVMPRKPLGGDERRHKLHSLRLRVVRGEPGEAARENDLLSLVLEPGRHVMQAYLMDGRSEMAPPGSRTLHFESEPAQTKGGYPFEPWKVFDGNFPPMWELKMEESKLHYPADYPMYAELQSRSASESANGHSAFTLEIMINGLLQWAMEPLLEDERDSTNLEALRDAKPDLVDDSAWESYRDGLAQLEAFMKRCQQGHPESPIEFALIWRQTVAAVHQVLLRQEND